EAHHAGPVQVELAAYPRDRAVPRPLQHVGLELVREPRPGPRPGHLLDAHPAVAAADPTQCRAHERRHAPAVRVTPHPGWLEVMNAFLGLAAARTNRRGARWLELHDDVLGLPPRRGDAPALGSKQLLGQDAEEHPSDSFVGLHIPRRSRWGAP